MTNLKKELKSIIQNNDKDSLVNFLKKNNLVNTGYTDLCPNYEDYHILKELLKKENKSMAMVCIEAGFRVFRPNVHRESESLMHLAVTLGCPEFVQSLLDKNIPVNIKNCNQETPLILAAICGNSQITNIILSRAESKNYSNNENFSHFHITCMQNRVDKVKNFLICGADINQRIKEDSLYNPGFTALHFAVQARSIETVQFLVNSGADMTIQDKRGLSPLHLAFRMKNREMINSLLSVQCYFASNPADSSNLSHFHIACAMNNLEVVKDFVEKEVEVPIIPYNACNWSSYEALRFAVKNECIDVVKYLISVDRLVDWKFASSILIYAHEQENEEIAQLISSKIERDIVNAECNNSLGNSNCLVEKKSASNAYPDTGNKCFKRLELSQYTDLHLSVVQEDQGKVVQILKSYDHSIVVTQDARGKTPLHLAFERNQKQVIFAMLLCHLKFTENPSDDNGLSHFHISCTANNSAVVNIFIQKGVDINVPVKVDSPSYAGWTPLHFAIASGSLNVVKLLLTNGADYTTKNAAGLSAFDIAVPDDTKFIFRNSSDGENEWQLVELIISAHEHWKRDNFNSRGITPLHAASAINNVKAVKQLVSTDAVNKVIDADVNIWAGFTPLHLAAHYDNRTVITMLLNHNADTSIQSVRKLTAADCLSDNNDIDERLVVSSKNVCNSDGWSQFHLACEMNNITALRHYIKLGVNVNKPTSFNCGVEGAGKTPLHLAVERDNVEIVKLLLRNGASVHAKDCCFSTPLHECGNLIILNLLLEYGADLHVRDCNLMSAASSILFRCKDPDFFTALLEYGLDLNEKDRFGISRLYLCEIQQSTLFVVVRHIRRLLVLGVEMSVDTMNLFIALKSKLSSRYNDAEFGSKCKEELECMKKIQVDNCATLRDLLLMNAARMVIYSKNETVKQIIQSGIDLKRKYPIYSYLLILQFKRGLERECLLHEGKKSLSILLNMSTDCVLRHILLLLNDSELKYLNQAAENSDEKKLR